MICYVLAMGKQHVGPHVVVGYGIKIFWPGLFITSPDHLVSTKPIGFKNCYIVQKHLRDEKIIDLTRIYQLYVQLLLNSSFKYSICTFVGQLELVRGQKSGYCSDRGLSSFYAPRKTKGTQMLKTFTPGAQQHQKYKHVCAVQHFKLNCDQEWRNLQ